MSWEKREAVTNLVILGDEAEHKKKVGGLLVACPPDGMYPKKMNYVLVQQSGEEITLSGSASLSRQLGEQDIGKFVKCEFTGWGSSPNGKYKIIDVGVWGGPPNDAMKAWPRFAEFNAPKEAPKPAAAPKTLDSDADFAAVAAALADETDDLPF